MMTLIYCIQILRPIMVSNWLQGCLVLKQHCIHFLKSIHYMKIYFPLSQGFFHLLQYFIHILHLYFIHILLYFIHFLLNFIHFLLIPLIFILILVKIKTHSQGPYLTPFFDFKCQMINSCLNHLLEYITYRKNYHSNRHQNTRSFFHYVLRRTTQC